SATKRLSKLLMTPSVGAAIVGHSAVGVQEHSSVPPVPPEPALPAVPPVVPEPALPDVPPVLEPPVDVPEVPPVPVPLEPPVSSSGRPPVSPSPLQAATKNEPATRNPMPLSPKETERRISNPPSDKTSYRSRSFRRETYARFGRLSRRG